MIIPTKRLLDLIEIFPTRKAFADRIGTQESTLSKILDNKMDVPKSLMESIHEFTGWGLDDLFDVKEDK